jgi:TM2 domain-containing membrane protein YozV
MNTKQTYGVPALLSFFVPGLGQVAKGEFFKALGIWTALAISWVLSFILIGLVTGTIVWLWQIYDAYTN